MSYLIPADRTSWLPYPTDTDFPIQNLPFGLFNASGRSPRVATALGDQVVDLAVLAELGLFADLGFRPDHFRGESLNPMLAQGLQRVRRLRLRLAELFDAGSEDGRLRERARHFLHPRQQVRMLLPVEIGDYTDFYSSREHAEAVGRLFRDPEHALLPNWLHLPVAYHGRASSIVPSGTPIRRPQGQYLPAGAEQPVFGPTRELDFELELAMVIGRNSEMGKAIPVAEAEAYLFGLLLFNDWSARDLQRWEYRPLGPFLGKNFASTVSPWVIPLDALQPFWEAGCPQEPTPLPYLRDDRPRALNISLEVALQVKEHAPITISRGNARHLYWSIRQQLAHHTVNGCPVRIGDLLASGTISGPGPGSAGSLLELSRGGRSPLSLPKEQSRTFLEDGDTVYLRAWAEGEGFRIGFGEAAGTILPPLAR